MVKITSDSNVKTQMNKHVKETGVLIPFRVAFGGTYWDVEAKDSDDAMTRAATMAAERTTKTVTEKKEAEETEREEPVKTEE